MMNYNITGIPSAVSAKDLEGILVKRFPDFKVTYPTLQSIGAKRRMPTIEVFDDSCARKEWDWKPEFDTIEKMIDQFEKDMKEHPKP